MTNCTHFRIYMDSTLSGNFVLLRFLRKKGISFKTCRGCKLIQSTERIFLSPSLLCSPLPFFIGWVGFGLTNLHCVADCWLLHLGTLSDGIKEGWMIRQHLKRKLPNLSLISSTLLWSASQASFLLGRAGNKVIVRRFADLSWLETF